MSPDSMPPVKSPLRACLTLAAAVLVFAVVWTAALLALYPDRLRSPDALLMALGLDLVPAALHALVLGVAAVATRSALQRAGLAFALGFGLVVVPWAMRSAWSDPVGTIASALAGGLAWGALARAVASGVLPFGDVLARGTDGIRRAVCLVVATAAGLAAVAWIDSGLRFSFPEWALSLVREAPFVWAWMSVPPPEKPTKKE